MKIHIDPHTLERAEERGANENEIKDVIDTGRDNFCLPRRISTASQWSLPARGTLSIEREGVLQNYGFRIQVWRWLRNG